MISVDDPKRGPCMEYKVVPPQLCECWLIIPINYRYYPLINPSYSTYKPRNYEITPSN